MWENNTVSPCLINMTHLSVLNHGTFVGVVNHLSFLQLYLCRPSMHQQYLSLVKSLPMLNCTSSDKAFHRTRFTLTGYEVRHRHFAKSTLCGSPKTHTMIFPLLLGACRFVSTRRPQHAMMLSSAKVHSTPVMCVLMLLRVVACATRGCPRC